MIIAVDVDDVCADLISEWLRRYNLRHEDSLTPGAIEHWDLTKAIRPGVSNTQMFSILKDPDLYDNVQPIPGAREACERLRKLGRVIFVTAGNGTAKLAWLHRWRFLRFGHGALGAHDFYMAADKSLINADVLIDDHVGNLKTFRGRTVLVERPHNRHVRADFECIRGLEEAPALLLGNP